MSRPFRHYFTAFAYLCLLAVGGEGFAAEPTASGLAFFEKKIRPVLVEHCYKCHSASSEKVKGGLLLDTREGIRKGGESGHAVVPGDLKESLLISALKHDDFEMPPKRMLPAAVVADFEKWIRDGAVDPRRATHVVAKPDSIDIAAGKSSAAEKKVTLVKDGKANATIVIAC